MRALVSADDVAAVLTAHVDRAHDAAVRLGCRDGDAVDLTADSAAELIEALWRRPETVGDLVGGLYARTRLLAERRVGQGPGDGFGPGAPPDEEAGAALAALPEQRRLGVLLVDSYGLSLEQAAIGVGLDVPETARSVALGRLAVAAIIDGQRAPSLAGHDVAVGDLGQLADGSAARGGRFATLRRHVAGCATCAGVLAAQTRGRSLVAGLPVLVLDTSTRADLLDRAGIRARAVLPTAEQIQAELDGRAPRQRLLPASLVVLVLLVAAVLGGVTGALLG